MRVLSRTFSVLLLVEFVFAGASLAGALYLRYVLAPRSFLAPITASRQASAQSATDQMLLLDQIDTIRVWDTAAGAASLVLCGGLCWLGLMVQIRANREVVRRERIETEFARQQEALEKRILDRTNELRLEVEERRRAEEFNRGQKQVLEMLTASRRKSTSDILKHLASTLATQQRSWECSIHLMEGKGTILQLKACSQVDARLERYLISIGAGFPDATEAKAAASGQITVVERVTEVHKPWSTLLLANGIYSVWSVPFRTSITTNVAGTLTIYCRLQGGPSARDLELTESAANLAALVIEHRSIHDELVRNAYQDALTGLPNRRSGELALQAALSTAQRTQQSFCVIWFDLDRFKHVNDQMGHGAGDDVLRAVAGRLRGLAITNAKLARMGGDEFLVLIPDEGSADQALKIGRLVVEAISSPISTAVGVVEVGASIGICFYPQDADTIEILEHNADLAMYHAKSLGGGCCLFSKLPPALSKS